MMEDFTLRKSNSVAIETMMNSSFSPPNNGASAAVLYALIGLSVIVMTVTLPVNIYVLVLILKGTRHGVASEFFSVNICVCEITICVTSVPSVFNVIYYRNEATSPMYLFLMFFSSLHNISRPFFQCCVCVEQYIAVIHPVIFLKYKPLTYRIVWSVVSWTIILGLSFFFIFSLYINVFYYLLLPEYLLLFSIKILCSIVVLKALKKPRPGEKLRVKDAESNHLKRKAFYVIVISLVTMVVTYFPAMLYIFLYSSLSETQKFNGLAMYVYLMIFGGFVHPFLYLHKVGKLPFIPDF